MELIVGVYKIFICACSKRLGSIFDKLLEQEMLCLASLLRTGLVWTSYGQEQTVLLYVSMLREIEPKHLSRKNLFSGMAGALLQK